MKLLIVVCLFLILLNVQAFSFGNTFLRQFLPVHPDPKLKGNGGGVECVGCTLVVSIIEQLAEINNQTVEQAVADLCYYFDTPIYETCLYYVDLYGSTVIADLVNGFSPDEVCVDIDVCTNSTCRLFPSTSYRKASSIMKKASLKNRSMIPEERKNKASRSRRQVDPWQWFQILVNQLENHRPVDDLDGDNFSQLDTLRGAYWRGKDCNDFSNEIYPGRKTDNYSYLSEIDYNCNGIFGSAPSGQTYESLLCDGTGAKGTIVIGDSASAHFHIPLPFFVPSLMNTTSFDYLLDPFVMDEFDWPHLSWATGHLNDTTGDCPGPVSSIYLQMRQRNLCNHRDYQTLAVNGANSGNVWSGNITNSISRNQTADNPALVFYSLIGNDVCHPEPTLNVMTTPEQFAKNVLESLTYLDTILPSGSGVVFVGLANGSYLYSYLHNRTYPLSPEITYKNVYDFLNCLEVAPCWVWMNSNETIRTAGTDRAAQLSAVYDQIIANYTFKNFKMMYVDFPIVQVAEKWISQGGEFWQLIEPLDGFHPNQIFQALEAQVIWSQIEQQHPEFLSPVNPNNPTITKLFGDQGGY